MNVPTNHPATFPTPEQRTTVKALRARLRYGMRAAPHWPAVRAKNMLRLLDAHARHGDRRTLGYFLADWQAGIEAECRSLEWAAGRGFRKEAA